MTEFRRRLGYVQEFTLHEQLDDNQWDYLMWNVHPIGGPRLRRGTVTFIKHGVTGRPSLGWPLRRRPRWRGVRVSWRWDR